MSDTRPPITAGPIERAFRFLKSASLSDIGEGEGLAVADGDGVSCADKIEIAEIETNNSAATDNSSRHDGLSSRCTVVGQAHRLAGTGGASAQHLPLGLLSAEPL